MMRRYTIFAPVLGLVLILSATAVSAHDDEIKARGEKLGRVVFKTSCSPEAQKQFERALAMQHSFFFPEPVKRSPRSPRRTRAARSRTGVSPSASARTRSFRRSPRRH